jgi:serine/threonine protein kinase
MKVQQSTKFSSEAFTAEELLEQNSKCLFYKGYDKDSKQFVLIQHWPTAVVASPEAKEWLDQEMARFQQLAHPHILLVLKFLTQQQGISLISPYPGGGSLQARLSQPSFRRLPFDETRRILLQIGQAMYHAHQHHFLHGTLTPGTIFFTEDNHVVVTGFRFQSILSAVPNYHPKQDERLPNTWYMAPERFDSVINEKTDQYALGCLAYALLTGSVPFPGNTNATLKRKHQSEPPQPLTTYNPQIPANIEDAVLMALAKQPENRHESIQDFLRALEDPVKPRTSSPRSFSDIDASLRSRVHNGPAPGKKSPLSSQPPVATAAPPQSKRNKVAAQVKHTPPPSQAITLRSSGSASEEDDKNNPLTEKANTQGSGIHLPKGKRFYMLALVSAFLVAAIMATALTAYGLARNALHTAPMPTTAARKSSNHPSAHPTPIIANAMPSPTPVTPTPVPPAPTPTQIMSCQVTYTVTSQKTSNNNDNNTFMANITITNDGNVDINNWTLTFTFSDDDQFVNHITSGNANFSEGDNSELVTITNLNNDATIAAGQSLTISFQGGWGQSNPVPTPFILNNMLCH